LALLRAHTSMLDVAQACGNSADFSGARAVLISRLKVLEGSQASG
jgi:hypothetical protein